MTTVFPPEGTLSAPDESRAAPPLLELRGLRKYFLAGGVYRWNAGYTNNNAFVSNELRPPDEPRYDTNTLLAPHQFWNGNGVNCAGAFQASAVGGSAIQRGTWAVEVTSTRTDVYAGISYKRESAPSYCQSVRVNNGQVIQVQISNVPGGQSYNVYMAPPSNGCAGPFGYVGRIAVSGPVTNDTTSGCPSYGGGGCSLGHESAIFDATVLTVAWAPNPLAAPGVRAVIERPPAIRVGA